MESYTKSVIVSLLVVVAFLFVIYVVTPDLIEFLIWIFRDARAGWSELLSNLR